MDTYGITPRNRRPKLTLWKHSMVADEIADARDEEDDAPRRRV